MKMKSQRYRLLASAAQIFLAIYLLHQFGITHATPSSQDSEADPPVKLMKKDGYFVLTNGIINVTLSTPSGFINKISYDGTDNLLEENYEECDRGYWDIDRNPSAFEDRLNGTSYKVIVENENQTEISFVRTYNSNSDEDHENVPLNVDKRFVMLRGSHGFYTYTVLERLEGWPNLEIVEARIVFKLKKNMSYYMAMSDVRQRIMPTEMDRDKGKVLDYKEAVQLVKPSNLKFDGEVDDKYFYSCENKDNKVYGWVSLSDAPIGFWMITPSSEFRTGGPFKQDLTSHVGPTILNMFTSTHYAGPNLTIKFSDGEPWKKVLGPVFVYLNSDPKAKDYPSLLWEDAKKKMLEESSKWPYEFPDSKDFVKSNERGVVRGRLFVLDRHISNQSEAAAFSYVGLAKPGAVGSWQTENKGYQFWTKTDPDGNFTIENVIAGTYNLYGSVHGRIGDYKYDSEVKVYPGSEVNVGDLVYEPPRNGPTLWEIGIPDRKAAEFFIPEPPSVFKVHKYKQGQDRFREYGLWRRYTDLYPKEDLVFTVGKSNWTNDWFYAHVPRLTKNGSYVPTTWKIVYNLPTLKKDGKYTLQLALASARLAKLDVRFNDEHARSPHFATGLIGDDNAVARHGIHGLYWFYSIDVESNLLVKGNNTIFLRQTEGSDKFNNVMYDYIRFEVPQ